jgi:hypothetical protein
LGVRLADIRDTKINWLKNLPKHMKLPPTVPEVWVWWGKSLAMPRVRQTLCEVSPHSSLVLLDLICIPQRARSEQRKAIDSLCVYTQQCSRFIALVRDAKAWQTLYDEDISHPEFPTAGALETYAARGWCRLELLASLAPKKFKRGAWRPGPRNIRFRFHHNPEDSGIGPLITAELLRNPMDGNFTVDNDRNTILPVLKLLAGRFAE